MKVYLKDPGESGVSLDVNKNYMLDFINNMKFYPLWKSGGSIIYVLQQIDELVINFHVKDLPFAGRAVFFKADKDNNVMSLNKEDMKSIDFFLGEYLGRSPRRKRNPVKRGLYSIMSGF